jgi:uncharacterized protein involved in exopolysaccharide biosynthesis
MGDEFTFEDVLIILKRRLLLFAAPAVAVLLLGLFVVMLLPAKYTAQGVILVVGAEIPSDLVRSTISAYAQERIEQIKTRVMTRARVLEIADKYNLFPRNRGFSDTQRVNLVRQNVSVKYIRAEGAQTGVGRDNTIAFSVSYTDRSPDKAYQAANELMSVFLTEDVRTRTTGASNTTEFFKAEAAKLAAQVSAMEEAIAKFKTQNADALPETLDSRKMQLDRAQQELSSADAASVAAEEELRFIETQLTSAASAGGGGGGALAAKRAELAQLRSVYTDSHPAVIAARREVSALSGSGGGASSREVAAVRAELTKAGEDLIALEKATPRDQAAVSAKRDEISALQKKMSAVIGRSSGGDLLTVQLQGRHAISTSRLDLLRNQKEQLQSRIAMLEDNIARTPEVDRGLSGLTRDYQTLSNEYKEMLSKQQDSQLAQNMEANQKAEKFSILDPAVRPDKPSSPDRAKLSVLALFLSLLTGAAVALGAEMTFATIRGKNHLTQIIEAHPIAVIPYIRNGEEESGFKLALPKPKSRSASADAGAESSSLEKTDA